MLLDALKIVIKKIGLMIFIELFEYRLLHYFVLANSFDL